MAFRRTLALAAALLMASTAAHAQDMADFFNGSIKFLQRLKTCTPFGFTYVSPFVGETAEHRIVGKENGACHVMYIVPTGEKDRVITRDCHLSEPTIALMTTEEKFKQLRDWETSGSTSDPVNKAMDRECHDVEGPRRSARRQSGGAARP